MDIDRLRAIRRDMGLTGSALKECVDAERVIGRDLRAQVRDEQRVKIELEERRLQAEERAEHQERCVLDGTDSLLRTVPKVGSGRDSVDGVVRYLRKNDLSLLVSDKEGGFVLMKKGLFDVKGHRGCTEELQDCEGFYP
ncbi:hypothetical protein MTO96_024178 [Rhipicephalus appendiculatus]